MTAKEEDILTSRALIKKGTVITELLKSCLVDKNIDPDSLISGDRNAIMTAVRITGYGSDYTVDIDCPACSEKSKQNFKLTELGIKRLEIEPVEIGKNLFEFKLPVSGKTIRFKFLTGKDEQEITVTAERKRKQGQQSDNLITQKLMYSVVAVDGTTDKVKVQSFVALPREVGYSRSDKSGYFVFVVSPFQTGLVTPPPLGVYTFPAPY
jgi:hypothetical protein